MKVIRVLWAVVALTFAGLVTSLLAGAASRPTGDPLPGSAPFSAELEQKLMTALGEKGASITRIPGISGRTARRATPTA